MPLLVVFRRRQAQSQISSAEKQGLVRAPWDEHACGEVSTLNTSPAPASGAWRRSPRRRGEQGSRGAGARGAGRRYSECWPRGLRPVASVGARAVVAVTDGRGRCCPALAPVSFPGGSIGAARDKLAPFWSRQGDRGELRKGRGLEAIGCGYGGSSSPSPEQRQRGADPPGTREERRLRRGKELSTLVAVTPTPSPLHFLFSVARGARSNELSVQLSKRKGSGEKDTLPAPRRRPSSHPPRPFAGLHPSPFPMAGVTNWICRPPPPLPGRGGAPLEGDLGWGALCPLPGAGARGAPLPPPPRWPGGRCRALRAGGSSRRTVGGLGGGGTELLARCGERSRFPRVSAPCPLQPACPGLASGPSPRRPVRSLCTGFSWDPQLGGGGGRREPRFGGSLLGEPVSFMLAFSPPPPNPPFFFPPTLHQARLESAREGRGGGCRRLVG